MSYLAMFGCGVVFGAALTVLCIRPSYVRAIQRMDAQIAKNESLLRRAVAEWGK